MSKERPEDGRAESSGELKLGTADVGVWERAEADGSR